jgi:hypothetical protein
VLDFELFRCFYYLLDFELFCLFSLFGFWSPFRVFSLFGFLSLVSCVFATRLLKPLFVDFAIRLLEPCFVCFRYSAFLSLFPLILHYVLFRTFSSFTCMFIFEHLPNFVNSSFELSLELVRRALCLQLRFYRSFDLLCPSLFQLQFS